MNSKTALKKLRELVGSDTYTAILELLSGSTVYFPAVASFTDREERDLQLKDDFYSGQYEVAELARKYDLSVSRVYKIIQSRSD